MLESRERESQWVFTARVTARDPEAGRQLSERRLLQYLKRVLKRFGLVGHLHTFRHAFISPALTLGTPEAIVRAWVGHVDRDVLKRYTHIADKASPMAMQRLRGSVTKPLQAKETANEKEESNPSGNPPAPAGGKTPGSAAEPEVANPAQNQHNSEGGQTPRGAK